MARSCMNFREHQPGMARIKTFVCILVVVVGFTLVCFWGTGNPRSGTDDANIYMVYGKHLSHGDGFVYNVNGERVEGVTSLLWTLFVAFSFVLTDSPEFLLLVFNILAGFPVDGVPVLDQEVSYGLAGFFNGLHQGETAHQ